jgi:cell division protein FtsL
MQAARKLESFESYESYRYREALQKREENVKRNEEKKLRDHQVKKVTRFLKTLSLCAFIFGSLAVMVYNYAALYEQQYVINGLQTDINQMTMDIEEVKSTLDSTISLDNVERVAMSELNMQYPQPEQIVYIKSNWNYALDKPSQNKYLGKKEDKSENLSGHVYDYILKFAFGEKVETKVTK